MKNARPAVTVLGVLLLSMVGFRAAAQQPQEGQPPGADNIAADATLSTQDEYVVPTVQNLSKLYWAIGKFDLNNDKQIDNYLLINECDLYRQYFHNDLEWQRIRDATRQKLTQDVASLPTRFEVLIPIYPDRYDSDKRALELKQESKLVNARKIDVNHNSMKGVCGMSAEIPEYPRNIVLLLNRPFSFTEIPMSPELAALYINDTMKEYEALPPELRMQDYKRTAYLRLKVHISQFKETILVDGRYMRVLVFAKLEGVEVYADKEEMKPLYSQVIDDKIRRRVRAPVPAPEPEQPSPSVPPVQ